VEKVLDRFLSSAVNNVDKKGRVSIPAPFRSILEKRGDTQLYILQSIDMATIDAGGTDLLLAYEKRMADFDPLTSAYDDLSFYYHGDSAWLKIDGDGRIGLNDAIRQHTGITDQVAFVGRGTFFQMWQPEKFAAYRREARERIRLMKQSLVQKVPIRDAP
jgi:MraZ protein